MTKQQREQGHRQLSFPAQSAASHMGLHQPGSSQPQPTWEDLSVLTPREVAVEQLLSRKLQAGTDQQGPVSIHFAQPQSPVGVLLPTKSGSLAVNATSASSAARQGSMPQVGNAFCCAWSY